jgi:hypothetical protein
MSSDEKERAQTKFGWYEVHVLVVYGKHHVLVSVHNPDMVFEAMTSTGVGREQVLVYLTRSQSLPLKAISANRDTSVLCSGGAAAEIVCIVVYGTMLYLVESTIVPWHMDVFFAVVVHASL